MRSGRPPTLWWLLIGAAGPDHRHALDDVRIERALRQEVELRRCSLAASSNTSMNSAPMILRFCSGSVTPASRAEEARRRVDHDQRQLHPVAEPILDLGRLLLAQQAVVDEDAGQPVADRLVHEQRRDRRIDAAATGRRRRGRRRPRPDAGHGFVDERRHRPVAAAAADVDGEGPQEVGAVLRVHDLGVEQQAVERRDRGARWRRPAPSRWWRRPRSPAARRRPSRRGWPRPSASAPGRRTAVRPRRPSHRHGRTRGATTASACRPGPAS